MEPRLVPGPEVKMPILNEIVDQLFTCLGPLRSCQEPIQDRCVDPAQDYLIDPVRDGCVDPVLNYLEVNPLGCLPVCGSQPSLPQHDSSEQQQDRAAQLGRTQQSYQYSYSLVRTFRIQKRNDQEIGVQGKGIAVADSVAFTQLPSVCWLILVLQHALKIIDNLLAVLELLENSPRREQRTVESLQKARLSAADVDDADLVTKTLDIPTDELERNRQAVQQLRVNLVGTLAWGQRVAR